MSSPELATLESLITERARERAQVIVRDLFLGFERELEQLTGKPIAEILISYEGRDNASVNGLLNLVYAFVVDVTANRLALQVAKEIIEKNQEFLKGVLG